MKRIIFLLGIIMISTYAITRSEKHELTMKLKTKLKNGTDVVTLFPKTVQEIEDRSAQAQEQARKGIEAIIDIPTQERTFNNTARAYDRVLFHFCAQTNPLDMLQHVSPDATLRSASEDTAVELQKFAVDMFGNNVELYQAFKEYVEGPAKTEPLHEVQTYFLEEVMKGFKRRGLDLRQEKRAVVIRLQKELAELGVQFSKNIAQGQRSIEVTKEELEGLDEDFIQALARTEDEKYRLGTDYPTYTAILERAKNENTRKNLTIAFNNRAYPENMPVLEAIVAKRDELARAVGFRSYAHLDLDDQMAKKPERVQQFIAELAAKASTKEAQEYRYFTDNLPEGVTLTADKKIKPWDRAYIVAQYKKKFFDVDEHEIAAYFPMEKTIKGLMSIYEQFMNIKLREVPVTGLWHPDVRMIEVYSDGMLRGYLLLDLYPRENKYSHAASFTMVSTILDESGKPTPAVDVVVANFPKSTPTKPSLLNHRDVETFFHEFGHAIHTILGTTELASFSGTHTKTDFVEMPSQMLEEWLWDPAMLKKISSHYQTGRPMPDELIEKKIALKNLDSGGHVLRQLYLSRISLDYFKEGAKKDLVGIAKNLYREFRKHMVYEPAYHEQAAFGHLGDYGAKYYGYMWSQVFALDMFSIIKQVGLLNPAIGTKYVREILAKGGSFDPNILLKNFLGREPNQEAFLKDLGLSPES